MERPNFAPAKKGRRKLVKILMVCLGNICRSPLAQGIMEHLADTRGLHAEVDSAGTGSWHVGSAPHKLSQKVALQNGIDLSVQRARQLAPEDFTRFDLILFMDRQNRQDGLSLLRGKRSQARTALLLEAIPDSGLTDVPDPYYGGEEGFHAVYHLIHSACSSWLDELSKTHLSKA